MGAHDSAWPSFATRPSRPAAATDAPQDRSSGWRPVSEPSPFLDSTAPRRYTSPGNINPVRDLELAGKESTKQSAAGTGGQYERRQRYPGGFSQLFRQSRARDRAVRSEEH